MMSPKEVLSSKPRTWTVFEKPLYTVASCCQRGQWRRAGPLHSYWPSRRRQATGIQFAKVGAREIGCCDPLSSPQGSARMAFSWVPPLPPPFVGRAVPDQEDTAPGACNLSETVQLSTIYGAQLEWVQKRATWTIKEPEGSASGAR